jgi:putative heme transporter
MTHEETKLPTATPRPAGRLRRVAASSPTAVRLDQHRLVRAGVFAWSVVGLGAVLGVVLSVLGVFQLVVVPLTIALFPAALLSPISGRLIERGWSAGLAAATVVLSFVVFVLGLLGALGWLIAGELGDVVESLEVAYVDARTWASGRFGWDLPRVEEVRADIDDWFARLDVGSTASSVASTTVEMLSGVLLGLIALFFYLKDGDRMVGMALRVTPHRFRDDVAEVMRRMWATLGGYFRGQIIVAATDAVLIGLGLALLGVPLAVPLAILVFFGGLFPIVGAFAAGAVAVLVALADGGIGLAIAVLVLNIAVQQVEGNVLGPLIVGRATQLHPLLILASLAAGAILLGIVGAFLAVPITACIVRAVAYFLERDPSTEVGTDADLPVLDDHVPAPVSDVLPSQP